jgi:TRAP-type transport system periplasmic protein
LNASWPQAAAQHDRGKRVGYSFREEYMRRALVAASVLAALSLLMAAPASAQDAVKFKFSHWVIASHPVSQWIQKMADDLRTKSQGKIDIEVFPNQQLGNAVEHLDMVRRGTVDMGWILHGYTSDRFPLTTLFDIPFVVDSAELASRVANDPELRAKYFDPENRGVKTLVNFTNQPTHLYTASKPIRTPADLKGQRIRFPSATAKRFIEELGAQPVGLPGPGMAEALQKGTIDGVITDHGAVGITFKLGGLVKHATELKAYVVTFSIDINPDSYAKLKGPLKEMFDETFKPGTEVVLGNLMNSLDGPGKKIAMDAGMDVITPTEAEMQQWRAIGKKVGDEVVNERAARGVPAKEAFALMQQKVAHYRSQMK